MATFRVGFTRDFLSADGRMAFKDIGLEILEAAPHIEYEFFSEHHEEVTPQQVADYDAVITYIPRFTQKTLRGAERLTVVARFGVGYDMVDVLACTDNDVALAITPDGVRLPMAEGSLTLMLALAKQIIPKERILRDGRWDDHKFIPGCCLAGKVIGSIGVGNIGAHMMRLLEPFGLARRLAYDPYCPAESAAEIGIELVDLDTVMRESDFICIHTPLTDETRGMIGAHEIGLMKESAFLVNTARGPIIDQMALTEALQNQRIRGAGLDVFEVEPIEPNDPLLDLDNVILLPHSVGWTDEIMLGNGSGACEAALAVSHGQPPKHVVNRDVLDRSSFKKKLARYASQG